MSKSIEGFKEYLHNNGAEVLPPTNPYELVRFRNANGVGIVYEGKRGRSFVGEAAEGWRRYKDGRPWKLVTRARQQLTARKKEIAARDGMRCFAHNKPATLNELTIEHLLSFSQGGNDNNNNLVLVCDPANKKLDNKPLAEKIELIIQMRSSREAREVTIPPLHGFNAGPIIFDEASNLDIKIARNWLHKLHLKYHYPEATVVHKKLLASSHMITVGLSKSIPKDKI